MGRKASDMKDLALNVLDICHRHFQRLGPSMHHHDCGPLEQTKASMLVMAGSDEFNTQIFLSIQLEVQRV
jgi:hypothetical protein